jgi:NADP-dependent 3-hydroxy acid dehydrogenase YdfG
VTGRGKERLDDVAASDPQLTGHQADGGDATAMAALAESLGTVDVLVVSLSGAEGMGPIASLDLAVLRRAFDAKFRAHLTTIQAVLPHLAEDGSITLLGAISAHAAMPGTAGIGALNAAAEALVKPLAVELAATNRNLSGTVLEADGGARLVSVG